MPSASAEFGLGTFAFSCIMQVLLAVWVAGATRQSTDLWVGTASEGLDSEGNGNSLVVGGGSAAGWGAFKVEDLTASTGTKIVFNWAGGHNVVMTTDATFTGCIPGDADSVCLATDTGSATGDCDGGNIVAPANGNYKYEAVMMKAGEYYFICGVPGHCASQKIKVTVTGATPGSEGDAVQGKCAACCPAGVCVSRADATKPECAACVACNEQNVACPASASPPPAESAEDSAAASLGSGALGTAMLVTATTALLRGLLF